MNNDDDRVGEFLKGVVPPEHESDAHRQRLRGQILSRLETGRAGKSMSARWRTAALLLGLLCAGALATESIIQVRRYHFEGRDANGTYHFEADPSGHQKLDLTYTGADGKPRHTTVNTGGGSSSSSGGREMDAAAIEQKRKDFEDIEVLRQQKARKLVGIIETVVNGKRIPRTFQYKYVLPDGRSVTVGESDNDLTKAQLEQQYAEIDKLRAQGKGDIRKAVDTGFDGQTMRTLLCYYVLSDGREVSVGESDTNVPAASKWLTTNQWDEFRRLTLLKKGEFLGKAQDQVCGRKFIFNRYLYKLSDGTLVTQSEGELESGKSELTTADWKELGKLMTGKGQAMNGFKEEVEGEVFYFTSTKYVLSDGTEVIWSKGEPESAAGKPATAQPASPNGTFTVTEGPLGNERKSKDSDEIETLRQHNARELAGVVETVVNGKRTPSTFLYNYVLANGRSVTVGESDYDPTQAQLDRQNAEIDKLRAEGKGDIRKVFDTVYEGQTQRTLLCCYVLSDGRMVRTGESDTNLPAPSTNLPMGQLDELYRIANQKKGKFLGKSQDLVCGHKFNFKKYQYKLSDGTLVTQSEGDPEDGKCELTTADWKELGKLMGGKGQAMGGYNEQVKGKVFHFTSTKYILSDGTEVIQSRGKPESAAGKPATAQPTSLSGKFTVTLTNKDNVYVGTFVTQAVATGRSSTNGAKK